jgi:hypothetical protein
MVKETEDESTKRNMSLFIVLHLGVSNRRNAFNQLADISTAKCLLKNEKPRLP